LTDFGEYNSLLEYPIGFFLMILFLSQIEVNLEEHPILKPFSLQCDGKGCRLSHQIIYHPEAVKCLIRHGIVHITFQELTTEETYLQEVFDLCNAASKSHVIENTHEP
jgi:hypothetical protein